MANILRLLLGLLFPNRCLGCRAEGTLLCERCLARLDLALPLENDWQLALFFYGDEVARRAVQMLKYHNRRGLAETFGKALADFLIEELSDRKLFEGSLNFLIIPIPMSRRSRWRRGYNQAGLIARALGKQLEFPVEEKALIKIKQTARQVTLKIRRERLKNLEGAFAVKNPEKISGRHIILVDDVITTGATMGEAAKVLKQSGARSVLCVALAH